MSYHNTAAAALYEAMVSHIDDVTEGWSVLVSENDFIDTLEVTIRFFPELIPDFADASGLLDVVQHYTAWCKRRGSNSPRPQIRQALLESLYGIFQQKVLAVRAGAIETRLEAEVPSTLANGQVVMSWQLGALRSDYACSVLTGYQGLSERTRKYVDMVGTVGALLAAPAGESWQVGVLRTPNLGRKNLREIYSVLVQSGCVPIFQHRG